MLKPREQPISAQSFLGLKLFAVGLFALGIAGTILYGDKQGVSLALLGLTLLMLAFSQSVNWRNRRRLLITWLIFLDLFTVAYYGSGIRQLAPFVNFLFPHIEMIVAQVQATSSRDNAKAQSNYIFRVFELSFESKQFARVGDVYVSRFSLEIGSNIYKDSEAFWEAKNDRALAQSCHARDLKLGPNTTITCQLAFEVPRNASNGVLFYDSSNYKAWADISF